MTLRSRALALGAAAILAIVPIAAMAAVDAFMQFDGVKGAAVTPSGRQGAFEIEDYSFDIEQVLNIGSQSSGAGAGKVTFNPFSITRKVDQASPQFFQMCANGSHFPQIVLETKRANGAPVTLVLHDVAIRDCRKAGGSETFTLAPAYATVQPG